jgi:iron complex outermembrane receptor protein
MNRDTHRSAARALLAGAFVCLSLCWTSLTLAQENSRQHDIDIAELPLAEALQAFSRQTGLQYGYLPTDEEEERTIVGPIKGSFTASEVLSKLLPEGFTFEWINIRTISIVSPPVNAPPPGDVKQAVAEKDRQRSEMSEEQKRSMAYGGGKSGSTRGPYALGTMVVEGQRIIDSVFDSLDLDIPATAFDRDDIDASGASTVSDLFRYVTQQPNLMPGSYLGDGTQFADLRGLGFDTTLVLINGRRTIATASALTANAFDLNSVPLGAVDRIEIVSDSTSAIHGADAIGGVVNIVLRRNMPEPRLDIDYGAADGGGVERHASFGASGNYGRARGSIVLDYFDRSPLLGRERDRWNNQDFTRFGGRDWRSPSTSPGNVSSVTGENLPGLSSSFAGIPATSSGASLTPADFVVTDGQQNLESLFRYNSIEHASTRKGVAAEGEYGFTQRSSVYGEFLYINRESSSQIEPPALSGELVGSANPYNPFGSDVLVDVLLTDLGPRAFARSAEMIRSVGGLRGRARNWDWEVSLQKSLDDAVTRRSSELDPVLVREALATSDPRTALDPFGSKGANSPALLTSLLAPPSESHLRTEAIQSLASARGPLATLPAGALELTAGAEWREERVRYLKGPPEDFSGSNQRSIVTGFGELRLPLLSEAAQVPAVRDLTLVLSGRFDDYSDVGQTFNPEYALIWRPTAALTLRASLAESFRPPPLFDLYMPHVDATLPIADPARDGEFAAPVWHAGGNPDLKPSSADSLSVGLRFEPKGPSTLRLAANYWRIAIDDTIAIPSAARLLAAENLVPDRVVRGPPSPADLAAGRPGPVQVIDITRMNFGTVRTSGVDVNGSITLDTRNGRFKPELSGTWVHDFTTSNLVDGFDVSRVGVANFQGTIPRWRVAGHLSWTLQGFGITTAVRYLPSYDDALFSGGRNGRKVASQAIVDAQLFVDLGELIAERSPWNGFEIRAGAFNLFDEEPPFTEMALFAGFDLTQADLRQRFAYVKIAKKF